MTPYRFALLRIAFGLYLIVLFYIMSRSSTLPESSFIYWGLIAISALFLLGYRRQLVARSLAFFSYLLFAFESSLLKLDSVLMMFLLLYFALIDGNEPWRIKTVDNDPGNNKFDSESNRLTLYMIFEVVLFGGAYVATYAFQYFAAPDYSSWTIWSILILFATVIFPKFLFRAKKLTPAPILFFDGVCGLCNHFVDFVFTEDTQRVFQVATLQGQSAAERLPKELRESLSTLVVASHDGKVYQKSEAVLNLLYGIGGFWRLFFVFRILPRPFCDLIYMFVAKFRYKLFGKNETCRLPTSAEKALFLN